MNIYVDPSESPDTNQKVFNGLRQLLGFHNGSLILRFGESNKRETLRGVELQEAVEF